MKNIKFIGLGILFGIIMTKSEAISWFRIQEMFLFQSFHMYGIIGVAVGLGALIVWFIKKNNIRNIDGNPILFKDKDPNYIANFVGGTCFGLGWAITGACPGPLYVLLGHGVIVIFFVILGAIAGTFTYGAIRSKLPH